MARIKHGGDWNTNPKALDRLGDTPARAVSLGIAEAEPVDLVRAPPARLPLLWLTGNVPLKLGDAEANRLKAYLLGGGTLFVDPSAGDARFFQSARSALETMFGAEAVQPVPVEHALLTGRFAGGVGTDVRTVRYSKALAASKPGEQTPVLWGVEIDGRLAAVLSRYGVTCPLEGHPTYGQMSLTTEDARRLAANVVLYAHTGGK